MSSRSKKRRRRLLKYGAIAAGTLGALYLGSKFTSLFGGGGGEAPATGESGSTPETDSGDSPPLESPTVATAGMGGIPTPVLIGGAVLVLFLLMKKK